MPGPGPGRCQAPLRLRHSRTLQGPAAVVTMTYDGDPIYSHGDVAGRGPGGRLSGPWPPLPGMQPASGWPPLTQPESRTRDCAGPSRVALEPGPSPGPGPPYAGRAGGPGPGRAGPRATDRRDS